MSNRHKVVVAVCLVAVAALVAANEFRKAPPKAPASGKISLKGKFVGAEAAEDASAFAGVCFAVSQALEQDGKSSSQRITNGVQLEDLRVAISEWRFSPQPFRERQPHVRAAVGKYLDEVAGTSGGPIDQVAREKWITAFRDLSAAAEEAVR